MKTEILEPEKTNTYRDSEKKKLYRLRPIGNWVLIRNVQEGEKKTEAGVIIPETQLRSQTGFVVDCPSVYYLADGSEIRTPFKQGDLVIYTNFVTEIPDIEKLTGESSLGLVRIEEIYAVVEPAEESAT